MPELDDETRERLFKGFGQNPLSQLLHDRAGIRGPIKGSPDEFCRVLCRLTRGELNKPNETVSYECVAKGNRDILKFSSGSLFKVVKALGGISGSLIVVTPYQPSMDDLLDSREMPLSTLVATKLRVQDAFARALKEFREEERRQTQEKAAEERRISRESRIDVVLSSIEQAASGQTITIRGRQNIDALLQLGFTPGLVDNPDNWVDAEDFPGMRYRHARSGIEVLLTAREKLQPIEELNRLEFFFLVNRSDDDPAAFERVVRKFRETRKNGAAYPQNEFHDDLMALVRYPEELKGRTEEDLGLVADEVEQVIDRRQELDKGILPYEAVFTKDTPAIVAAIVKNRTPATEIRKALDYFEYTGMIDSQYKAVLQKQIKAAMSPGLTTVTGVGDLLYDKRVKEIVAIVLKKIPRQHLTASTVTLALTPFVSELGFGKLVKIRDRVLQLKEVVRSAGATE